MIQTGKPAQPIEDEAALGRICHSEIVRAGITYWFAKRGDRAMPSRPEIDPAEMKRLLPHIALFDVMREPLDFRYRLIGTEVRHHMIRDLTGARMSELDYQRPPSQIWSNYERVLESQLPLVCHPPYVGPQRDYLWVEDGICPLGTPEDGVTMLLVFVDFLKA